MARNVDAGGCVRTGVRVQLAMEQTLLYINAFTKHSSGDGNVGHLRHRSHRLPDDTLSIGIKADSFLKTHSKAFTQ